MDDDIRSVEYALRSLDIEARLAVLLTSIIQKNPGALFVSLSLLNALTTLSSRLSVEHRFQIAEELRDAADMLERVAVRV